MLLYFKVTIDKVKNVIIWGNHSSTQFPDARHASVDLNGKSSSVFEAVGDDKWLNEEFVGVSICCKIMIHSFSYLSKKILGTFLQRLLENSPPKTLNDLKTD